MVSGGGDGTVRAWNATSGAELARLIGHVGRVRCCAVSPDGTLLFSGGEDSTLRGWAMPDRREVLAWVAPGEVCACAVRADGLAVAVGDAGGSLTILALEPVPPP